MSAGLTMPFAIGDQLWLAHGESYQVTRPCPICEGTRIVTVILGSGEQIAVECEACGKGYDGPRGYIKEWEETPRAERFEIAAVTSFYDGRWTVKSTTGTMALFEVLRATEAEALAEATSRAAAQRERNMETWCNHRKRVKEASWSVRYHREQIRDLERRLAWHRGKLDARAIAKAEGK